MTAATASRPTYLDTAVAAYRVQEYLGVDYIAEKMGVTPQHLNAHKWLLPNWGESEVAGVRRWRLSTIRAWLDEMTPAQRQATWDALPESAKVARAKKWGVR